MADKIINVTNQRPFVMVYNDFLASDLLSAHERIVFIYLKMHAGKNDSAFPSLNTLAKETRLSKKTVQRCIESMKAKGVIRVERRESEDHGHQSNLYKVIDVPSIWGIKADETGKVDLDKIEEMVMIERLREKGYVVTKENGPTSETGESTGVSPKETKSYTKDTNKSKKKQAKKSGNNFTQREYDYDALENQLREADSKK